jgi:uncharacterized protein YlxW (UPF0749 family)
MGRYEMIVAIVAIVMFAMVLKARYGHYHRGRRPNGGHEVSAEEHSETLRLREEVKQLKERIHVLERIAVDKDNSLSREIEDLRDR